MRRAVLTLGDNRCARANRSGAASAAPEGRRAAPLRHERHCVSLRNQSQTADRSRLLDDRPSSKTATAMLTAQVAHQSAFTRHDRRRHHRSSCRNGGSCWPASISATSIGVRRSGAISRCILASATPFGECRNRQTRSLLLAGRTGAAEGSARLQTTRAKTVSWRQPCRRAVAGECVMPLAQSQEELGSARTAL